MIVLTKIDGNQIAVDPEKTFFARRIPEQKRTAITCFIEAPGGARSKSFNVTETPEAIKKLAGTGIVLTNIGKKSGLWLRLKYILYADEMAGETPATNVFYTNGQYKQEFKVQETAADIQKLCDAE
ncbi:hypothetical protein LCGC14_1887520 [marine sediment metagenome]|uniref:Uncharacterized protein n=1 Tax=marine sediment metagenome TaxID=412755 RepID=A0A0F9IYP1_9ZZZZ|nr:hypothetical protein [Pricia sp.]